MLSIVKTTFLEVNLTLMVVNHQQVPPTDTPTIESVISGHLDIEY